MLHLPARNKIKAEVWACECGVQYNVPQCAMNECVACGAVKEGSWTCAVCYRSQDTSYSSCITCDGPRPPFAVEYAQSIVSWLMIEFGLQAGVPCEAGMR